MWKDKIRCERNAPAGNDSHSRGIRSLDKFILAIAMMPLVIFWFVIRSIFYLVIEIISFI